MVEKEREAFVVEDEISNTKQILNKLRYAIVSNYYQSLPSKVQMQTQESIQDNDTVQSGIKELDQMPIHPSLKKLIGKKPLDFHKIINSRRTTRGSGQEVSNITKEKVSNKVTKSGGGTLTADPSATSTFCESNVFQLTSSRGKNQLKHTIVVGNTSQYLHEKSTSVTHKWMCYVKTRSSVPIDRLVKKVRFHLDSTYKPNDVVDVSAPFQLTKRGYGEFQVKVLIFFKDDLNLKPVTVYHQLTLDKKFTGLQMLGNETVTELWTRNFLDEQDADPNKPAVRRTDAKSVAHDHDYYATDLLQAGVNQTESDQNLIRTDSSVIEWIDNFYQKYNISDSDSDEIEL